MCVDKDGRTSQVQLVQSSGSDRLDQAAIKGLENNRFEPAMGSDNKPIELCGANRYVFTYVWDLKEER
jgi:TonB family protein